MANKLTNKQIDNRVKKMLELDAQIKALTEQLDSIKNEVKEALVQAELDEINTGNTKVSNKEVVSNRLDSKALKLELPDVAKKYTKVSSTKRFLYGIA